MRITSSKLRVSLEIDGDLYAELQSMAKSQGCTVVELFRRAFAIMKAADQQRALGRAHLGIVSDPSKLDVEITGLL